MPYAPQDAGPTSGLSSGLTSVSKRAKGAAGATQPKPAGKAEAKATPQRAPPAKRKKAQVLDDGVRGTLVRLTCVRDWQTSEV